jgi:hypothetical protein
MVPGAICRALNLAADGQAQSRLSPLIAVDQGEELFASEDAAQSNRFLDMMGHLLGSPRAGLDPYVLLTIRADSVDALLQRVQTLGLVKPHTIPLTRSRQPLTATSSPSRRRSIRGRSPASIWSRSWWRRWSKVLQARTRCRCWHSR